MTTYAPLDDIAAYEHQHPHAAGIGPSDIGSCRRRVGYRVTGAPPDRPEDPLLARSSFLGSAVHAALAQVNRAQHPTWLVEQAVRVPGMDRDGTLDAYDPEQGLVIDYKTRSSRGMEAVLGRGKAYDHDVEQTELYGLALEDAGHLVKVCAVAYVDRNGHSDPLVDSWTYDRDRAVAAVARLHALADAIDAGAELPRDGKGPDTGRPCDTCQWISTCWQLDSLPAGYSAQSAYLAPTEVAEAAEQLRVLRLEAAKVKEATDYLRLQLQGHAGATFVDAEGVTRRVAWSRGSKTGGQLDSAAVRARYADLGETPPGLGAAPKVTTPAVP